MAASVGGIACLPSVNITLQTPSELCCVRQAKLGPLATALLGNNQCKCRFWPRIMIIELV
jgi:hypothetical protein